jgi:hypothetical protein
VNISRRGMRDHERDMEKSNAREIEITVELKETGHK